MKKIVVFIVVLLVSGFWHSLLSCTIFTASSNKMVLAGNNEDMCTTNTVVQIIPPSADEFGRIFWEFKGDGNYQGGMNEHGLFFDGAGTPAVEMAEPDLPEFDGGFIMEAVLESCKTVEEAIEFVKDYSQPYLKFSHILLADATGDAVILEWGNNKMNFVRKGDKNYLIATNFNLTESTAPDKECNRYSTAKKMLANNDVSVALFEEILSLTHAEGNFPTVYSTLCNLRTRKLYLYNFHNYTFRKEIDLVKEFEKGEQKHLVRSFFSESNAELFFRLTNDCIDNFEDLPLREVTFQLYAAKSHDYNRFFIRGSAKELGEWNEDGVNMDEKTETCFTKTITFKEGKLFDYSIEAKSDERTQKVNAYNNLGSGVIDVRSDTTIVIDARKPGMSK